MPGGIVASEGWESGMPRHSGFSDSHEIQEERQRARGNQGATMFRPPANIGPRKCFTDRGHKSVEQNTE
jgi:hypothetical protein